MTEESINVALAKLELKMEQLTKDFEELKQDVKKIQPCFYQKMDDMKKSCVVIFVPMERFKMVEKLVYSVAGIIFLGFWAAVVKFVFMRGTS